jgi:hypothetical protein
MERDFSSIVFSSAPQHLPEIKAAIRAFRKKIVKISAKHRKEDVYQCSIQLLPLTKRKDV